MFGWLKRQLIVQNVPPPSAVEVINDELERLHNLIDQFTGEPHDYLQTSLQKLHDALIGLAQVEAHNKVNRIISGNDN